MGTSTRRRAPPRAPAAIGGAKVYSLTQVLNELLALGIQLEDVVRMVTCNAAAMLGMTGEIGTLAPGAVADVTVLATDHGRFTLSDSLGEEITSSMRLRPEITVRAGKVSRPDSPLLGRSLSALSAMAPTGEGMPPGTFPDLRAEPEGYLLSQILLFKAERRSPR